jgi:cytochrome P450
MDNNTSVYNMPKGYDGMRTALRSYRFLRDPINFISTNMALFKGTYSARLPQYPNFIITQDAAFINHVLRDNHTNYHRSPLSSGRVAEYLGKGLLFVNGETWLKQRRLIQPGFHREKIQALYQTVTRTIDEFLQHFTTGASVDVYPLLHQLAFNVVINSLFDIRLSPQTMHQLSSNFNDIQDFVIKDINQPFRRPFYILTGAEKKTLQKSDAIKRVFNSIIQQRRQSTESHNDLLDMLLQSTYEDTGQHMTDEQVIDELLVFMFAGHETTANTLAWLLHLLAANPAVLNTLTQTIQQTHLYDSPKNEYINAVINEGMRLYPAAWMNDRVALADDSFGGYTYPKGTIIISFFYGAHRDGALWPDADVFNPQRFLDETGKARKYKNYFPFGAGPRMCIGNNFAMAEMAFFLHAFLTRFTVAPGGKPPLMKPLLTLRPGKVLLNVKKAGEG